MHQYVLVITEKKLDERQLAHIMEKPGVMRMGWDWYQIGGRYTGRLKPDYDPERDERNWERCGYCEGTGVRRDSVGVANGMVAEGRCNGCTQYFDRTQQKGVAVKWPTQWTKVEFDQRTVAEVLEEMGCSKEAAIAIAPFGYIINGRKTKYVELGSWSMEPEQYEAKAEEFANVLRRIAEADLVQTNGENWVTVVDVHT